MGLHHRLTTAAVVLALAAGANASKRKQVEENQQPPPDRLATGELPLGNEKAYALPLPRGSQIATHYGGDVVVVANFAPEVLANFVRYHVRGGKVTVGTSSTQFEDVYVPEEPKRMLWIEVRAAQTTRAGSTMVVRDSTGGDPKLPPDEHFKQLGLTPDGKLADPKHTE